jgi:hypothetical protein
MKKIIFIFVVVSILLSTLFFGCDLDKEKDIDYYNKCFFLGDTAFLLEGETTNIASSIITRISAGSVHYSLDIYSNYNKGWEILSTEISENKIEIPINITANGVTLDSEILSEGIVTPMGFPNDFPSCELVFIPKKNGDYRRIYTYSIIDEIKYRCSFVYVAEPVDLSGTQVIDILQWQGDKSKVIRNDIFHYDYNFTKPGWYKIVDRHNEPIGDNPRHSSVSNIYFYEPNNRY